jgi:hypothetical protein
LGFHPESPSHTQQKTKSTIIPLKREMTSVDVAIIGTDLRVEGRAFAQNNSSPRERLARLEHPTVPKE